MRAHLELLAQSLERWFRELTDKAIRREVFGSVSGLIAAIEEYLTETNENAEPFVWTASADESSRKSAEAE